MLQRLQSIYRNLRIRFSPKPKTTDNSELFQVGKSLHIVFWDNPDEPEKPSNELVLTTLYESYTGRRDFIIHEYGLSRTFKSSSAWLPELEAWKAGGPTPSGFHKTDEDIRDDVPVIKGIRRLPS
jgi:hypothetical protein